MAEFMSDDAVRTAIDPRGRGPECADLVGDAAAERGAGAAAWTWNHEKKKFVFRGVRFFLVHPFHRVHVIIVEAIALFQNGVHIEATIRNGIGHGIVAVFLGPEQDEIVSGSAARERIFAGGVAVIIAVWYASDSRRGNEHFFAAGFKSVWNVRRLAVGK